MKLEPFFLACISFFEFTVTPAPEPTTFQIWWAIVGAVVAVLLAVVVVCLIIIIIVFLRKKKQKKVLGVEQYPVM